MKQTKRVAILEAFASSKPYEFDGFVAQYLQLHPEPEPVVVPVVVAPAENHTVEPTVEPIKDKFMVDKKYQIDLDNLTTEEPKRKRKRTRKAAPPVESESVMEV